MRGEFDVAIALMVLGAVVLIIATAIYAATKKDR
jgi:hypothetical protein